jgi:hypothetical protein
MDWESVTLSDLSVAISEVEWRLRPMGEFMPLSQTMWSVPSMASLKDTAARMKANVYFYRSNYAITAALALLLTLLRNLLGLLAIALVLIALSLTHDSAALAVNEWLLKLIKRVHKPTAMRLRGMVASLGSQQQGLDGLGVKRRPRIQKMKILWVPRPIAVALILMIGLWGCRRTSAFLSIAYAILFGLGLPLVHSLLRKANFKVKIANAREEFKAVWRGYQSGLTGPGQSGGPSFTTTKADYTQ